MKIRDDQRGAANSRERGFALAITLALLALLVLAVFALSALARVNSRIATASLRQAQARQNALLALDVALGELQRHAGPDNRITGMAGIAGLPAQSTFRHWTGVWLSTPSPVWLVSGAAGSSAPSLTGDRLTIVGSYSVGSPTDTTDQEPVEVGFIDVPGIGLEGLTGRTGRMAYWVGDEGVKVSAIIADDEFQSSASNTELRPDFHRLISSSFNPASATNSRIISIEQLKVATTGFSLPGAFHALTRSHAALGTTADHGEAQPGEYVVGAFNVNTTSAPAWRALLEFPDSNNSKFGLGDDRALSAAREIGSRIANRAQPFGSVSELLGSGVIQTAFDRASPKVISPTQDEFITELSKILTTRSDTFRIRGYGDVIDPVDDTTVTASGWCEAIVQRTPELAPNGHGQRFIVTYFRWLGRDDI